MRVLGFSVPLIVIIVVAYAIGARFPGLAQKAGIA